jgi:CRP/FNR family cyclic AMP-dependent transcriptional regulator
MFHTPTDVRVCIHPSVDRLFDLAERSFQFPADRDLCSARVPASADCDATRFAAAARRSPSATAFRATLSAADWRALSSFCIVRRLPAGARVVVPGRADRTLRFVVEGTLQQTSAGAPAQLLHPGAILGEDTLFSDAPCELDVRTLEDTRVLELSLPRQKELTAARPALAFELLRAAGAVIAARCRAGARQAEPATV